MTPTRSRGTPLALPRLAMLPLLLAACGGDAGADGGAEWQGTVRDSAGVEIVSNTDQGTWSEQEAWTVEPDLRIGSAAGAPELQFGMISGLDIDSEGRIYVLDQQAHEVRVFSPGGDFIARIGKAGSGPGELSQGAGPLFVGPGDTLIVPDMMQQRVNLYTPAGEFVRSYPIPLTDGIPVRWLEAPDGRLVQQAMMIAMPGMENLEPSNRLLLRNTQGEVVDTLMELPMGETFSMQGGQPQIRMFESEPMWALTTDGNLIFGDNSDYRFQVRSTDGELVRIVEKAHEPKPISQSDAEEFRRLIREAWERSGMPPQAVDAMSGSLEFAEHYPAYANLFGGPDGSLWVQALQSPEAVLASGGTYEMQDMGGPMWDVFDDRGRFLGEVQIPGRFMPLLFDGDHIYGVLRDDMDVQYAARMRVNRGGAVEAE